MSSSSGDLHLSLADYIRNPNHYSYNSYVFFPCESFSEFVEHSLESDLERLVKRGYIDAAPVIDEDTDYSSLPIRYLVLSLDSFLDEDLHLGVKFISAFIRVLDLPDYDERDFMAELICRNVSLFISFQPIARNVDDYPLNQQFVNELSDLHNSIPYQFRHQIEKVQDPDDY